MNQHFKDRIEKLNKRIERNTKDTLVAQEELRMVFAQWAKSIKATNQQPTPAKGE